MSAKFFFRDFLGTVSPMFWGFCLAICGIITFNSILFVSPLVIGCILMVINLLDFRIEDEHRTTWVLPLVKPVVANRQSYLWRWCYVSQVYRGSWMVLIFGSWLSPMLGFGWETID